MLRIDLYQFGSGIRVRLHHHAGGADDPCESDCHEHSLQRAYPEREASPAETRTLVIGAVAHALKTPTLGHVAFVDALGDAQPLF